MRLQRGEAAGRRGVVSPTASMQTGVAGRCAEHLQSAHLRVAGAEKRWSGNQRQAWYISRKSDLKDTFELKDTMTPLLRAVLTAVVGVATALTVAGGGCSPTGNKCGSSDPIAPPCCADATCSQPPDCGGPVGTAAVSRSTHPPPYPQHARAYPVVVEYGVRARPAWWCTAPPRVYDARTASRL